MFASVRGLLVRHRRTALVLLGAAGCGYLMWVEHRRKLVLEEEHAAVELITKQLQRHFESIQRISDTTALPFAMHSLHSRIVQELDISNLTERLLQGKGESNALTPKEKYDTWEKIKVLSFTRTLCSMWAMTLLSLYVRVQVTILGRHLYLDFARAVDDAQLQGEYDGFSRNGQEDFLVITDYLAMHGIRAVKLHMKRATTEILKEKQLEDPMSMEQVSQTITQILDLFMSLVEKYWINYLVPESAIDYAEKMAVSSGAFVDLSLLKDVRKLDNLISETRIVLSSADFRNITERSLRKVADVLVEDLAAEIGDPIPTSGLPFAKILARVSQLSLPLLEEPKTNKHIQIIQSMPEVETFYVLLYANISPET